MELPLFLFVALLAAGSPPLADPLDPELVAGIRLVKTGDFEEAVLALEGVVRRLSAPPERSRDLVQAYLYLGIAHVALGKNDPAKLDFREALARDKNLNLTPESFSPKVVSIFREAQSEFAPKRGGGKKTALILAGVGGAAATGVLLAKGGSTTGTAVFSNARFGIEVVLCPAGTQNGSVPFSILVDASNGNATTQITSVTTTLVIVSSPAVPSEVGFSSTRSSVVVPESLPAGTSTTLRVDSSLFCSNPSVGPPRFNEWVGRLTLTTTSGVFTLETQDRLHVNIP